MIKKNYRMNEEDLEVIQQVKKTTWGFIVTRRLLDILSGVI